MLIKEHTASSIIDALPEEIWTEIIRIYALGNSAFQYISVDLLLPLMLDSLAAKD